MARFERFRCTVHHAVRACLHGGPGGKLAFDLARGCFAFCHLNGLCRAVLMASRSASGSAGDIAAVHMDGLVNRGRASLTAPLRRLQVFAHGLNLFAVFMTRLSWTLEVLVAARGTPRLERKGEL